MLKAVLMDIHAVLLRGFWPVLFRPSVVLKCGLPVLLSWNIQDKSVVERSVQIIEKDILPEMARLDIFTLHEFNSILHRKLARRLAKPYTKRYGARASVFDEEEKTTLLPLPVAGYHSYTEKEAAVGRDGYIQYSSAFYSVPPSFIKKKVIVRESEGRLYIYDDRRQLIAEHDKAVRKWQRVTSEEHRKADLALYGGYSREEFDDRARSIGPAMFTWVQAVKDRCDCFADSYRTLLVLESTKKGMKKTK